MFFSNSPTVRYGGTALSELRKKRSGSGNADSSLGDLYVYANTDYLSHREMTDGPPPGRGSSIGVAFLLTIMAISLQEAASQSPGIVVTPVGTTFGQNNSQGFAQQYEDADVDCSAGTYQYHGTTDTQGNPIRMTIVCDDVTEAYTVAPIRFTPWKAIPTIGQSCLAQNTQSYNFSQLQKPGVQSATIPPVAFHTMRNLTGVGLSWGTLATIGQTIGCSAANSFSYGLAGAFGGSCAAGVNGISVDEFASYTSAQSALWQSQQALNGGMLLWKKNATDLFGKLINGQEQTRDYQVAMSNAVSNITQVVKNQQIQIDQIITQTAAGINDVKSQLVQTNQNVNTAFAALSALAVGTQSEFNRTLMFMVGQFTNQSAQINYLTNQTEKEIRVTASRFMGVQQSIMQLSTMVLAITTQSQYLPMMKQLFNENRRVVEALNVGGANYQFMVESMGHPGVANPRYIPDPSLVSYTYDNPQAVFIYTSPGNLAIAATWSVQLNCGGFWISLNQYPFQSWTQIMNSLGPSGCSTDEIAQGPNFCNCWMQARARGCAMPTTGGLPTSGAKTLWDQWDNPGFPTTNSFCTSGVFDIPIDGLSDGVIRNATDFTTWAVDLCKRGVNPSVTGYKVFSPYFGQRYFSRYTDKACFSNIMELMNPDPQSTSFNIVYSMMNFFVAAASLSATSVAVISDRILGSLPQNTTITTQEFQVTGAGPLQSCKLMVATAFDMNKFTGLFRYTAAATTKRVTVYVNDELYSQIDDGVVSNVYDGRKIPDGAYISGLLGEMWVGSIYDRPYASGPSPSPYGNQGSPDYAGIPALVPPTWPTTYSLPIWRAYNVFEFNHAAAATSYEVYYNGLICESYVPVPFRCRCNPAQRGTASDGVICSMLDAYDVSVISETAIAVTSAFNRVKVRIRIPQGQMLSIAGSACPLTDTSTSIGINFNEQTVGLKNTLAMVNRFRVRTSGICGATSVLELQPLETFPFKITYCAQQPGVPIVLTFENNPGVGGGWTTCPGNQTVLITPAQPTIAGNGTGAPFVTTENRRAVSANAAAIDAQTLQTQNTLQFLALTKAVIETLVTNSIPLAPVGLPPLGSFGAIFDVIKAGASNASTTLQQSINSQFEYTGLLTNYSAINQQLLRLADNATAQARAYTEQLSYTIQQSQNNLYNLIQINGQNQILLNNSVMALEVMNQVTENILASARARGTQNQLAFDSLIDFLTGIGEFPSNIIGGVLDTMKSLGGSAADMFKGGFSAIGNVILLIVMVIAGIGILGVIIWVIIKFGAKADCANGGSEVKALEKRVAALEARFGLSTAGLRRHKGEGSDCCTGCCSGPSQPYSGVADTDD